MKSIHIVNGETIFHDPTPDLISLFKKFDSGFQVRSIQPGRSFTPKFQCLRDKTIVLENPPFEYSSEELMAALEGKDIPKKGNRYSALDILYVLSLKTLNSCSLCGWHCGVNRFNREKGKCGLSSSVYCAYTFIHIAEETVINPSMVTNLGGCAMRCLYCIDHQMWDTSKLAPLDTKKFWEDAEQLGWSNINTIEFTNPTESLYGIIHVLLNASDDFRLPLVMNCHLYGSQDFYRLADPITDVWLPDLRYGNDACAKALSGVDHYMETAKAGLDAICKEGNRAIVRILVLPGHNQCCHEPAIKLLSKYKKNMWVSILDQYVPEHKAVLDPTMSRRPTSAEIEGVNDLARKYGLRDILECGAEFWGN